MPNNSTCAPPASDTPYCAGICMFSGSLFHSTERVWMPYANNLHGITHLIFRVVRNQNCGTICHYGPRLSGCKVRRRKSKAVNLVFCQAVVSDESVVNLPGRENQSGPNHFRDGYPLSASTEGHQSGRNRTGGQQRSRSRHRVRRQFGPQSVRCLGLTKLVNGLG